MKFFTRLRSDRRSHVIPALVCLVVILVTAPANAARRHARLVRSVPAKDSTLAASPATIQLWFSEPVELGVSRIRLETAEARAIPLGALTQDRSEASAPVTAPIPAPLPRGAYTVHWTAASKDGHPMKGTFGFVVGAR